MKIICRRMSVHSGAHAGSSTAAEDEAFCFAMTGSGFYIVSRSVPRKMNTSATIARTVPFTASAAVIDQRCAT